MLKSKHRRRIVYWTEEQTQQVVDDLVEGVSPKEIHFRYGVPMAFISKCKTKYTFTVVYRNDVPVKVRHSR